MNDIILLYVRKGLFLCFFGLSLRQNHEYRMNTKLTKRGTYNDELGGEYSVDGKTLYHFRQVIPDMELYKVQDGCEVIGRMAFKNSSLKEIVLPESVTIIRDQAFFGCSRLRRMNIPRSLRAFETEHTPFPSSFSDLYGESDCYQNRNGILYNSDMGELLLCYKDRVKVEVPQTVKRIASQAFINRLGMKEIILPDGLETVGDAAFMGCTALTTLTIPHTVTAVGKRLCWGCHSLQKVILPQSIKEVPQFAFFSCDLREVSLPEGIKKIGEHAFGANFALTRIQLPNTVRSIGASAFEKCESLEDVHLPERIVSIERSVFEDCRSLRTVNIPSSVHRIKSRAFSGIKNLTVNINKGQTIIISDDAFDSEDCLTILE